MPFCIKCGAKTPEGSGDYCPNCSNSPPPIPQPQPQHSRQPAEYLLDIWDPKQAIILGIIFTPLFTIIIHYLNWKDLRNKKETTSLLIWGFAFIVLATAMSVELHTIYNSINSMKDMGRLFKLLLPFIIVISNLSFEFNNICIMLYPIFFFVAWYFLNGKKQIEYVEENYGDEYEGKSWRTPVVIAILIPFIVGFIIGFVNSFSR